MKVAPRPRPAGRKNGQGAPSEFERTGYGFSPLLALKRWAANSKLNDACCLIQIKQTESVYENAENQQVDLRVTSQEHHYSLGQRKYEIPETVFEGRL